MNNEIRNILLLFLKEKVVTASWGVSEIRVFPSCLVFSVEAMRYQGIVKISPINTTDCSVCLSGKNEFRCRTEDLVYQLDKLIESSDNYYANLLNWFYRVSVPNTEVL